MEPNSRADTSKLFGDRLTIHEMNIQKCKVLVNMGMDSAAVNQVLLFLSNKRTTAVDRLPSSLIRHGTETALESLPDLLLGCTPLHCAALTGNAEQVGFLLKCCQADPTLVCSASLTPIELVPDCRGYVNSGLSMCICGSGSNNNRECTSGAAQAVLAREMLKWESKSIVAWLSAALLVILCMIGLKDGLSSPFVLAYLDRRAHMKKLSATQEAKGTLTAVQASIDAATLLKDEGHIRLYVSCWREVVETFETLNMQGQIPGTLIEMKGGLSIYKLAESMAMIDAKLASFVLAAFVRMSDPGIKYQAMKLERLKSRILEEIANWWRKWSPGSMGITLEIQNFYQGKDLMVYICRADLKLIMSTEISRASDISQFVMIASDPDIRCCCLQPDRAPFIWSGWAIAEVEGYLHCGCEACLHIAFDAVSKAQRNLVQMDYDLGEGSEHSELVALSEVGTAVHSCREALAQVLRATAKFIEKVHTCKPCMAVVKKGEQCLMEWQTLDLEFRNDPFGEVECLGSWLTSARADFSLAGIYLGFEPGPHQTVSEIMEIALRQKSGPSREALGELDSALLQAKEHASPGVYELVHKSAHRMREEVAALDALKACTPTMNAHVLSDSFQDALDAARLFPNLAEDVAQAEGARQRWLRRTKAQRSYDQAVESACASLSDVCTNGGHVRGGKVLDYDSVQMEIEKRISTLEAAMEAARSSSISTTKAKRILKELRVQISALEAADTLESALSKVSTDKAILRGAVMKAEEAAAAGTTTVVKMSFIDEILLPKIATARHLMEIERAADGLLKASASCGKVTDLPRLEAAILAAKKLNGHELHPEAYLAASELRARLDAASRCRASLESSIRSLEQFGRDEDAHAVEIAAEQAGMFGDLLFGDVGKAKEALKQWKLSLRAESRLEHTLATAANANALSLAIKEAAAAGVNVAEARRLLKLIQGLEAAILSANAEGPSQLPALRARMDAAANGGVHNRLLQEARKCEKHLVLSTIQGQLSAGLKAANRSRGTGLELSSLVSVIEDAEVVLSRYGSDEGVPRHHMKAVCVTIRVTAGNEVQLILDSNEDTREDEMDAFQNILQKVKERVRQLEEAQVQLDKERLEQASLKREQALQDKAKRESADKAKAEKAKAERAKRKEVGEAQREQRRERQRQLWLQAENNRLVKKQAEQSFDNAHFEQVLWEESLSHMEEEPGSSMQTDSWKRSLSYGKEMIEGAAVEPVNTSIPLWQSEDALPELGEKSYGIYPELPGASIWLSQNDQKVVREAQWGTETDSTWRTFNALKDSFLESSRLQDTSSLLLCSSFERTQPEEMTVYNCQPLGHYAQGERCLPLHWSLTDCNSNTLDALDDRNCHTMPCNQLDEGCAPLPVQPCPEDEDDSLQLPSENWLFYSSDPGI